MDTDFDIGAYYMPNDFAAVPFIMHMRMALSVKSYRAKCFFFCFFFSIFFQATDLIGHSLHDYKHLKQAKNFVPRNC
jgi:hypothetical protein